MKRKILITLLALCLLLAFSACGCVHEWEEADCDDPKTCALCGETEGESLGHEWKDASCTKAKTCEECGKTKGQPLGHDWSWDFSLVARICTVCGEEKVITYKDYQAMNGEERQAFFDSFESMDDFLAWLNDAKDADISGNLDNSGNGNINNTGVAGIGCIDNAVDISEIILNEKNAAYHLNVTVTPDNTTCDVVYESSDEAVAVVTAGGKITAIGEGEAIITVACGDQQAQCKVVCDFTESDSENPVDDPTDTIVSVEDFAFNREDISLLKNDQTWKLCAGDIPVSQIIWRSDDENIAVIKDGIVRATGNGITTVYAEYDGVVLDSCIVRCYNQDPSNNDQITGASDGSYISATDITVFVGESFNLYVLSVDGYAIEVDWKCDDNGCTASGNRITAVSAGTTEVYAEYNGYVHKCIVRVNAG